MGRHYVVDAYNFVLQDARLDGLVHARGLEEARRVFRLEAENLARRAGCRVRLIYDGARGPFEHLDRFENPYVEATFTSTGEKADERVVAVALEMVRRGAAVCVVSDDEEGVRRPLRGAPVNVMGTREFARLLRPPAEEPAEETRADGLSRRDRDALARDLLARDAAAAPDDDDGWEEIRPTRLPPVPAAIRPPTSAVAPAQAAPSKPPPGPPPPASSSPSPVPPRTAKSEAAPATARTAPPPPDPERERAAKKERGARKQARRLALLQSSHPKHPSRKPKR
jgi:predicted RNA-binding protein with PIN domain